MKILFVASVYRHLTAFHLPYIKYFQRQGYKVYVASTGLNDKVILENEDVICIDIPFSRSPIKLENLTAFKNLKRLLHEERFDLVHVHTPVASLLTRLAFKGVRHGKIVYTAHGFHFFKGAPKQNWPIYYTAEKLAAKWTDHLITINEEDYHNAQKLLPKEKISLVHGVGVEAEEQCLTVDEKVNFREQLGLPKDALVISYIAELNVNKNHQFLLGNWKKIKGNNPKTELLIIGFGEKEQQLKDFVKKEQLSGIHFLGYRKDVPKLLQISDVVSLLSHREGLPKSIMEAMVAGVPCVVSNTRGLRDLVKSDLNGFVVNHNDDEGLIQAFDALNDEQLRINMGIQAKELVKPFLLEPVLEEYVAIYKQLLK